MKIGQSDIGIIIDYPALWAHAEDLPWCTLVTTGRTGTDFFQSLLDSHPQLFVFNGKLFFHDFWETAVTVNGVQTLVVDDIVDEFIGKYIYCLKSHYDTFERKNELGENRDQSIDIDSRVFRTHVLGLLKDRTPTSRSFLTAVYIAYSLCLGENVIEKRVFFHHAHRINRLRAFVADFPDTKIICMTRDPRANYVSGVEHWRRYDPTADNPAYPLYILQRAVDEANDLHRYDPARVKMLRLEDLGNDDVVREVAAWIGIADNSCLRYATWGGLRWWGDRLSTSAIKTEEKGFSPTIVNNSWSTKLGSIDRFLLAYLLDDMLVAYGYSRKRPKNLPEMLIVPFLIFLPTVYERRYLAPSYLIDAVRDGRVRALISSFYHPLPRIIYFYKLLIRKLRGKDSFFPTFGTPDRLIP